MKRIAALLILVVAIALVSSSDVRAGSALLPAGKTTGGAVSATIVMDVTGPAGTLGKGLTSIRVQKAGISAAVLFNSSYVNSFAGQCIPAGFSLETGTANRFTGLLDGLVDNQFALDSLLAKFGNPSKAAITDQDYVACTEVAGRQILSFTAVIQFQP